MLRKTNVVWRLEWLTIFSKPGILGWVARGGYNSTIKRKNIKTCSMIELHTHCSKNEQNLEVIQIGKNADMTGVGNTSMWYYCSWATSLLLQEQRQMEMENEFLDCHVTLYQVPNGHANSLREITIYCIPHSATQFNENFFLFAAFYSSKILDIQRRCFLFVFCFFHINMRIFGICWFTSSLVS